MKNTITEALLIAVLLFAFVACPAHSSEQEKYVVAIPFIEGMGETSIGNLIKDIVKEMGNKLNVKTEFRAISYRHGDNTLKLVVDKFKSGEADISFIYGNEYAQYLDSGEDVFVPMFVLSVAKQIVLPVCIYTRKGEYDSIDQLRGKAFGTSNYKPVRYLLYQAGIDEHLDDFFGEVKYISDSPVSNIIDPLVNNEIDAFLAYDSVIRIGGYYTKKSTPFEPLVCEDYDHTWIFIARKGVDPDIIEKLTKIMVKSDKDPDFAKFQFAFKMVDGKFYPFQEKYFEKAREVYKIIKKNGWMKEEKEFYNKYLPGK